MTAVTSAAFDGGFRQPVFDAQTTFRAIMDALARPGRRVICRPLATAPAPMSPLMAAVALTLVDPETPVWLDGALAASADVRGWFAFQTGAPMVDQPADAAFAFVVDPARMPPLSAFAQGTPEYPDRSTTLVVSAESVEDTGAVFTGPGIETSVLFDTRPAIPAFAEQWQANRALFPRGVDLLFVAADAIVGLPRSSRLRTG
ncbi:phosphonate C-P lyase system protein PhnH [Chthonobacter albigriseus]|uniref:phosphonate C-P lyase system protein PhnH n=1 Tax=Chthonobacter albigriseus TaxID=1683161 RepID=UPI0015EEF289|nr:phosphonate C-P lyase system protein PhnH [Chthonobacter albigriseus]